MTVLRGLTLARAAVLAALPFGAACTDSSRCTDMGFARLREADRAVVTIDSRSVGNALRSPQVLQSLSQFAKDHASGWSSPWYGTPVARIRVDFFAGNRFLGDLGVGSDFLTAQGCGYVQTRSIDPVGRAEIIGLTGAIDPYAERR